MDDREPLLRAIAANPNEDTPRLMYADLLDELGGEANTARARFIRLQIETHHGPGDTGGTTLFDQQTAEAKALANRFGSEWIAEFPTWGRPLANVGTHPVEFFTRGFVERVRVNPKPFALRSMELFDTIPIRTMEVRGGAPELLVAVFGCPVLARLRELRLRWRGAGEGLSEVVAKCPHLGDLCELDLSSCALRDRDARILSRSERLSGLQIMRLQDNWFSAETARTLIGSPKLPNLRVLDLRRSVFSWGGNPPTDEQFPNKTVLY